MPTDAVNHHAEPVIVGTTDELTALDGSGPIVGAGYVPRPRQLLVNSDTGEMRVGDGDTAYNDLTPLPGGGSSVAPDKVAFQSSNTVPAGSSWTQLAWTAQSSTDVPGSGDPTLYFNMTDPTSLVAIKRCLVSVTAVVSMSGGQAEAGKYVLVEVDAGYASSQRIFKLDSSEVFAGASSFQWPLSVQWLLEIGNSVDIAVVTDATSDLTVNFAGYMILTDLTG